MTGRRIAIEALAPGEAGACEAILRSLPEWFGVESAIRQYRREMPDLETFVAREEGEIIGFLSIDRQEPTPATIHVLAVRRDRHRRGVGRALVARAEAACRARGVDLLEVRTLGPSEPNEGFAGTRAFYATMGFRPVEQTRRIWGRDNPCLIMRKALTDEGG